VETYCISLWVKYRRLDINGDYTLGRNRQNFLTDIDAVAQAIKTRLLLLYGEWWEDLTDGLPLWQRIIGSVGSDENKQVLDLIVKERINGTTNVNSVVNFISEIKDRKYTFTCLVVTDYGNLTVSV